jgi:hypothetical protein
MADMLFINNNGPDIQNTNYFQSEYAKRGIFYVSVNASAFRLLVPPQYEQAIPEFLTAQQVIISRGPWQEKGRKDAIEIMFDDHTDSPYALHFGTEQIDRLPPATDAGKNWTFSAWVNGRLSPVCAFRAKCYYRIVPKIPYMESL